MERKSFSEMHCSVAGAVERLIRTASGVEHVWDRVGRLVAHGSQLAGIRLG